MPGSFAHLHLARECGTKGCFLFLLGVCFVFPPILLIIIIIIIIITIIIVGFEITFYM